MNIHELRRIVEIALAGGCLAVLAGCASQSDLDAMRMRLQRQEQQIALLSGMQPAQADTWAQVQQLRQEMAAVKGEIDNFNHAAASTGGLPGMIARVERHDQALRAIETQFAMDLKLNDPVQAPFPGEGLPDATPIPGGTAPAVQNPGTAPAAPVQPAPKPQVTATPGKDTATVLYDTGIANFNKKNYKAALNAFNDFTATYPKHKLSGNAWFWRGESHFALGQYSDAALDYENVISKYPRGVKTASSYLKQGICFQKLGNKDAAKIRLRELVKKYPKSPEATRAKQILKSL